MDKERNKKEGIKSKPKEIPITQINDEMILNLEYEYLGPEKENPKD